MSQALLRIGNSHIPTPGGHRGCSVVVVVVVRPRRSRSAAAYSRQTFSWTICRSVCLFSALWQNGGRVRMPFGIIGRTGPGMRQIVGSGDRSTGRGSFWGDGARHCNQWGLYGVCVRQRRDAVLFPNYLGQTCCCCCCCLSSIRAQHQ